MTDFDAVEPIVVWAGRFRTLDGYGTAAQHHVNALRRAGVTTVSVDLATCEPVGSYDDHLVSVSRNGDALRIESNAPDRMMVVVLHDRPDRYDRVAVSGRSVLVGFSYWEAVGLPAEWPGWMVSMDRIWTASPVNAEAFAESGVPSWMIDAVGQPIDPLVLQMGARRASYRSRWQESTVFLSLVSSLNARRDLTMLLEAFLDQFDNDDDVALVLKTPAGSRDDVRALIAAAAQALPATDVTKSPTIHVVAETMSREQLMRLHASVDCYVSCERGDGWDLPAMDSLALGVPVVSSDFGASMAFLSSQDCYLVTTAPELVACDASMRVSHPLYCGHEWPYMDVAELGSVLARVHAEPDERRSRGEHAAARIRSTYNEAAVVSGIRRLLAGLTLVDVRAGLPAVAVVSPTGHGWPPTHVENVERSRITAEVDFAERFIEHGGGRGVVSTWSTYRSAARMPESRRSFDGGGTAAGSTRSRARRVVDVAPLSLAADVVRARRQAPRLVSRLGGDAGIRDLRRTLDEYRSSIEGRGVQRSAEEIESARRKLWSLGGPFRSPEADVRRLGTLRNRHLGERIFVLGNGPSLTKCNLALLADEFTIGVNKIHLLFDQIDWRPSYYTLLDWKMGSSIAPVVDELSDSVKFFPERFRGVLPDADDVYWYWPRAVGLHTSDQFEPDATNGIPSRATVLMTAIQQAFFLGFREIVLIGVDAAYTIPHTVRQSGPDQFGTGTRLHLESTADDDPNHFAPNYFGTGSRWHDPNVDDMHRVFRMMRKGVERNGGRLLNATKGGSLEVLDRVDFDSLFTS